MQSRESQIAECAQRAIAEKVFPGCVVGIVTADGKRSVFSFGNFTYDEGAPLVQQNTIYDVASITKSIPTGSLALQLLDQGKLKLTDKIIDFIPEFRNSDRERVLIKHLLTYTVDGYGLARAVDGADGASLHKRNAADLYRVLFTHDFEKRPGTILNIQISPPHCSAWLSRK